MRTLLLIFLVLASAHLVGAESVVYSAWHHTGDTFKIDESGYDDDIHYVSYFVYERKNDAANKLMWKINNKGFTISVGECKVEPLIKYCLEEVDWTDKDNGNGVIYRGGEEYPGLHLKVYKIGPELEVSRSSEAGRNLNIYERSRLKVEIANTGDRKASSIIYREMPPAEAGAHNPSSFISVGGDETVYEWNGFLLPGDTKFAHYYIKPITYNDFKIPATISFMYEGVESSPSISDLSISIDTPYAMSVSLTPSDVGLFETSLLKIQFKNQDDMRRMDAKIRVQFPPEVDLVSKTSGFMLRESGAYEYGVEVPVDVERTVEMYLRSTHTGDHEVNVQGEFDFDDEQFTDTEELILDVSSDEVTPKLTIEPDNVEGGSKVQVWVELENEDEWHNFVNIKGTLSGPLLDQDIKFGDDELVAESWEKYVHEELITPVTNKKLEHLFKLSGTFQLPSGEEIPFETQKTLTINPAGGDYFSITQDTADGIVKRGKNTTVTISVKNHKAYSLNKVLIEDELPEGIDVVAGSNKAMTDFSSLEKKQVYMYRLHVPEDYLDETVPVKTKISYQEYGFDATATLSVVDPVEPEEPAPVESEAEQDVPEEEPDEPEPVVHEPEKGIVTRIFEAVNGFFANLF